MKLITTLMAAVLVLAGCATGKPQESPKKEDFYQVTTRWISNPSVDLMSPEGTFIRAATESWDQIWASRKVSIDAIRDRAYPGFEHAFNNSREGAFGGVNITHRIVGTQYFEVVNFQREGDHFIADVCRYGSQVASQTDSGMYTSGGPNRYLASGDSFVFGPDPTLRPEQQHPPLAHQKGPANRPSDNVFGTWVLTQTGVRQGMDDATQHEFLTGCDKPAPGTPNNLPNPFVRNDPPATLPPDPGWPDAGTA